MGSHGAPWSEGLSSALSLPCCPVAGLFLTVLCLSSQVLGSRSVESPEKWAEAFFNESNHKVLREILLSFGNVNISRGKSFSIQCIDFEYMWVSPEMDGLGQGEDSDLRSEGKSHLGIMM